MQTQRPRPTPKPSDTPAPGGTQYPTSTPGVMPSATARYWGARGSVQSLEEYLVIQILQV